MPIDNFKSKILVLGLFLFISNYLVANPYQEKLAYWLDRYESSPSRERLILLFVSKARYNAYSDLSRAFYEHLRGVPVVTGEFIRGPARDCARAAIERVIYEGFEMIFAGSFCWIRLFQEQRLELFALFPNGIESLVLEVVERAFLDWLARRLFLS